MTGPLQLVVALVPLALYLYLLAIWQAGRRPRVLRGATDVVLLAAGVWGLILYGPFGQMLAQTLFGRPSPAHWRVLTLTSVLLVFCLARRAARRLVIYHLDAATFEPVLGDLLEAEQFHRTLHGYEDRARTRGLRVDVSPRWHWAVLEAYGSDPDGLIRELEPRLRDRLRDTTPRSTNVAVVFFGLSALTLLIPLVGLLLNQPHTRAALRAFLEHWRGG
jgi:hypothetical protein